MMTPLSHSFGWNVTAFPIRLILDLLLGVVSIWSFSLSIKALSRSFSILKQVKKRTSAKTLTQRQLTRLFAKGGITWEQLPSRDKYRFFNMWFVFTIICDLGNAGYSICDIINVFSTLVSFSFTNMLLGLGCSFAWFNIMRYFEFKKRFYMLVLALKKAIPTIVVYLISIFPVFFGFAFFGVAVFGFESEKFRDFGQSCVTLFAVLHGDVILETFDAIYNISPLVSRTFMYIYVTLFICVALNIFISILEEAYQYAAERIFGSHMFTKTHEILHEKRGQQAPVRPAMDEPGQGGPPVASGSVPQPVPPGPTHTAIPLDGATGSTVSSAVPAPGDHHLDELHEDDNLSHMLFRKTLVIGEGKDSESESILSESEEEGGRGEMDHLLREADRRHRERMMQMPADEREKEREKMEKRRKESEESEALSDLKFKKVESAPTSTESSSSEARRKRRMRELKDKRGEGRRRSERGRREKEEMAALMKKVALESATLVLKKAMGMKFIGLQEKEHEEDSTEEKRYGTIVDRRDELGPEFLE
eukprot:gnl/Carplike_NY0171/4792_a6529_221.p1 GENE.gnl/Carplike_NY0171/4792_a6529_221~~gnl/Carplike_NY0171/4792_a6529_221.p1  ORF type:complete len:622 (+),score=167.71 gnl/Carplike_NY0171/4792_a6529_221:265-1866(+)